MYDIDCDYVAGEVKIKLTDLFGEETLCSFIRGGKVKRIKVYEIDRQKDYDMSCAVAIEEADFYIKTGTTMPTCCSWCAFCARPAAARGTGFRPTPR